MRIQRFVYSHRDIKLTALRSAVRARVQVHDHTAGQRLGIPPANKGRGKIGP